MTTPTPYASRDQGSNVRCSGIFLNTAGVAIDPTDVYFSFINPMRVKIIYHYGVDAALVRDSQGNYHVDVSADLVGIYRWKMYSTGVGQAAEEWQFSVKPTQFSS